MKCLFVHLLVFGYLATSATANGQPMIPELFVYTGFRNDGIHRVDLNANTTTNIVPYSEVGLSTGVTIDPRTNEVYWIAYTQFSNLEKIRRSTRDGSNPEDFFSPAGLPGDLEIDPFSGLLYFSERITNMVNVIDLETRESTPLFQSNVPVGIDLDLLNGHLYVAERGSDSIRRSNLDGTNVVDIVTTGVNGPSDLAVNPLLGKMYWTENNPLQGFYIGRVFMANLDGTDPVLIHQTSNVPVKIDINHETGDIYWGEGSAGMYRASADGTNVEAVNGPVLSGYYNIAFNQFPLIPEPSSCLMIAGGSLALFRRKRAT